MSRDKQEEKWPSRNPKSVQILPASDKRGMALSQAGHMTQPLDMNNPNGG